MSKARRIYPLTGYSPEIIAVAFAKTSRSPEPFDQIARELDAEKSSKFHEKWVVGYGHSSVAEHAVLNIALENVSRYAVEAIEANRLASYTEKSSRYQVFALDDFYVPQEIEQSEKKEFYLENMNALMKNYQEAQTKLELYYQEKGVLKPAEGESERSFKNRLKAYTLDRTRFMLPLSSLANLGWTINARALEHALIKMLSHPLSEVREIGEEVKRVAKQVLPTLIKYANKSEYLTNTEETLTGESRMLEHISQKKEDLYVELVKCDQDLENNLIAAILYRFSKYPYREVRAKVKGLKDPEKMKLLNETIKNKGKFDIPLREFEHATLTFDCLVDYGAYFDLKRHRICTQTAQLPTIEHGYTDPGLPPEFQVYLNRALEISETAYTKLFQEFPYIARYFVLNAHRRRFLWQMNVRELMHVVKLRSRANGHFSYRKFAQDLYLEFKDHFPVLAELVEVTLD